MKQFLPFLILSMITNSCAYEVTQPIVTESSVTASLGCQEKHTLCTSDCRSKYLHAGINRETLLSYMRSATHSLFKGLNTCYY